MLTPKVALIGIALPDRVYSRLDPVEAQEDARRKSMARDAIRAEAADLRRGVIGSAQLKLLERARAVVALDVAEFAAIPRRHGAASKT